MDTSAQLFFERLTETKFAENLADLALEFLVCPERQAHATAIATRTARLERSTFSFRSAYDSQFLVRYLAGSREWTVEDASAALDALCSRCRCLVDWLEALLTLSDVHVHDDPGEPDLSVDNPLGWSLLTSRLDPEALVSYMAVRAGRAVDRSPPDRLSLVPRISDPALKATLDKGVHDYHVHLGGIRSGQALWRKIVSSNYSLGRVQRFARKTLARVSAEERHARLNERCQIEELVANLRDPASHLGDFFRPIARPSSGNRDRIAVEVAQERAMFQWAWTRLVNAERQPDVFLLEHELDGYLFQKHRFLSWHRQSERTNPGLQAFRSFYHATEPVWPSGKLLPARFEHGPRVLARSLAEYAAHCAQSNSLRRIELRIAPMERPQDYHRFLRAWKIVEQEFQLNQENIEIGFAVHFKRSLDGLGKKKGERAAHGKPESHSDRLKKFLRILDRDSAMLHAYRRSAKLRQTAKRILRIDFAGAERDVPLSLASFCMKLVRSDAHALEELSGSQLDPELHRFWLWHRRRQTATPAPAMPVLGQTCHVGEDYAHPVEGLYAIASAVDALGVRSGDTLGHGLALGCDIALFDRIRSPRTLATRGTHFDALYWLWRELKSGTADCPPNRLHSLEEWVLGEFVALYGIDADLSKVATIDTVRGTGIELARPSLGSPAQLMRYLEILDAGCSNRRAERVPIAPIVYHLAPQITKLQVKWRALLAERGIALEFNPSSNLRVSGTSQDHLPFIAILNAFRTNVVATLNTDDPGVFATRIENEYAIALRALRAAGFSQAQAGAVVERIREVGERMVYWPFEAEGEGQDRA